MTIPELKAMLEQATEQAAKSETVLVEVLGREKAAEAFRQFDEDFARPSPTMRRLRQLERELDRLRQGRR